MWALWDRVYKFGLFTGKTTDFCSFIAKSKSAELYQTIKLTFKMLIDNSCCVNAKMEGLILLMLLFYDK